jgi:hypothetical protein
VDCVPHSAAPKKEFFGILSLRENLRLVKVGKVQDSEKDVTS